MKNEFGGCGYHSLWTRDCIACNPTESNIYYLKQVRCRYCLGDGYRYIGDGMMMDCVPCKATGMVEKK